MTEQTESRRSPQLSQSRSLQDSRERLRGYQLTPEEQAIVSREVKLGALRSFGGASFGALLSFLLTRKISAIKTQMSGFQAFMVGTGVTLTGAYLPFVYSARHGLAELGKLEHSVLGQEARIVLQDYDPKYIEEQNRRRKMVRVVVLDEIDDLIRKDRAKMHAWIEDVYAMDGTGSQLKFIGISNSVDLVERYLPRIVHSHQVNRVVFEPYSAEKIQKIVSTTFLSEHPGTIALDALELLGRRVMSSSGDFRKVLDILIQACKNTLESDAFASQVSLLPMRRALSIVLASNTLSTIQKLTLIQKTLLATIVANVSKLSVTGSSMQRLESAGWVSTDVVRVQYMAYMEEQFCRKEFGDTLLALEDHCVVQLAKDRQAVSLCCDLLDVRTALQDHPMARQLLDS